MKKRTTEEMRLYMREYRARKKVVPPADPAPVSRETTERIRPMTQAERDAILRRITKG